MYYMEVKVGHKRFTFLHNYTIIVAIKDLVIVCQSSYIGVPQHGLKHGISRYVHVCKLYVS